MFLHYVSIDQRFVSVLLFHFVLSMVNFTKSISLLHINLHCINFNSNINELDGYYEFIKNYFNKIYAISLIFLLAFFMKTHFFLYFIPHLILFITVPVFIGQIVLGYIRKRKAKISSLTVSFYFISRVYIISYTYLCPYNFLEYKNSNIAYLGLLLLIIQIYLVFLQFFLNRNEIFPSILLSTQASNNYNYYKDIKYLKKHSIKTNQPCPICLYALTEDSKEDKAEINNKLSDIENNLNDYNVVNQDQEIIKTPTNLINKKINNNDKNYNISTEYSNVNTFTSNISKLSSSDKLDEINKLNYSEDIRSNLRLENILDKIKYLIKDNVSKCLKTTNKFVFKTLIDNKVNTFIIKALYLIVKIILYPVYYLVYILLNVFCCCIAKRYMKIKTNSKKKKNIMITPCNHCFHTECLLTWYEKKESCPVCRTALPLIDE